MAGLEIGRLKKAVEIANAELEAAARRLAPKWVGGESEAYDAAYQRLMDSERALAAAEGRPYAVLEEFPLMWDTGAPLPTLLQTDNETCVFFYGVDANIVGVVRFQGCLATSFGSPGDETFEGHPLHGSGFEGYRAMRVVNSPWIDQLRLIDSVHPRHIPTSFDGLTHFVFPFHDSTFECVAKGYSASTEPGSIIDAVKRQLDAIDVRVGRISPT
jgi:hypothetical protein